MVIKKVTAVCERRYKGNNFKKGKYEKHITWIIRKR